MKIFDKVKKVWFFLLFFGVSCIIHWFILYIFPMPDIEQLRKEADDVKNALDELKNNVSLSESEKRNKTEELKTQVEAMKQKIQSEIDALADKTDDESKRKKEEAETLLTSFNETMSLYASILNSTESTQTEPETQEEEKSVWWKTKEWVGEQWDDIWDAEKWKTEWGKNALRTAWFVATWVWAVALTVKGVKKLWNWAFWDDEEWESEESESKSKKKKKKEKSSWRKKWLLWAWWIAWAVFWWSAIYKNRPAIKSRFKEKLWDSLTMEQAVVSATAEVRSWLIDESPFHYNFDEWIQYDEQKKTIKSYWWETKIDPTGKKLVWLDNVVFKDYKELIHAANITNCLKSNFHNCCASDTPFDRTTWWGWDLQVTLADWSQPEVLSASDTNAWARIWWVWWWAVWGLLWAYCWWVWWAVWGAAWWATLWAVWWAAIDNNSSMWHVVDTIKSWENFEKFRTYLNQQKSANWKSLRPHENEDIQTESPLKELWKEVLDEIVGMYSDNWDDFNRNMDIIPDDEDTSRFYIQSYNEKVPLVINGLTLTTDGKIDYNTIKSIKIWKYKETDWWEWLDLDFPHTKDWVKEAIKVANLTNKIRKDFHDQWWEQLPFWVKIYWYHRHLQIDDRWYRWRDVVYRETLSAKFPTIWQDLKKQINETDQSKLRKQAHDNRDQEWCWSRYIRYLHQMREQRWNLSYWRHEND